MVRALICLIILLNTQNSPSYANDDLLTIISGNKQHIFNIEIAATKEQQLNGLMFRESMGKQTGMLFDYTNKASQVISMWMRNTQIPLDMLFIDETGKILFIIENTTPLSLQPLSSKYPVSSVLEINAGEVASLGIKTGDMVEYAIFH